MNRDVQKSDLAILPVIVFQKTLDGLLESQFVKEVFFAGLKRHWRFVPVLEGEPVPLIGNALYLAHDEDMIPYVRMAIAQGCRNVGLLHMGDEGGQCDHGIYPFVDYVIRVYFHERLLALPEGCRCRGVYWMPGGCRSGTASRPFDSLLPASQRKMEIFFIGFVGRREDESHPRIDMIDILERDNIPATIIRTPGWAQGYGVATFSTMMEEARFALIPRGAAKETIRLYDALEVAAIPISLRHDFLTHETAMAGVPFPVLDSWEDMPELYRTIAAMTPAQLDAMQHDLATWWTALKHRKSLEFAEIVEAGFAGAAAEIPALPQSVPELVHFINQSMGLYRFKRADFLKDYVALCFPNFEDVVNLLLTLLQIRHYQTAFDVALFSARPDRHHPILIFAIALGEVMFRNLDDGPGVKMLQYYLANADAGHRAQCQSLFEAIFVGLTEAGEAEIVSRFKAALLRQFLGG